jgi:hypothetical protein
MRPDQSRVIVTFNNIKKTDEVVMVAIQMDLTIAKKTHDWLTDYAFKNRISLAFIRSQKLNK